MTSCPGDIAGAAAVQDLIRLALAEDVGSGDATTLALVSPTRRVEAAILARHPVIVCGGPVACAVFMAVDPSLEVVTEAQEGAPSPAGATLLRVRGPARAVMTAVRTALNFMQRLTGIATLTRRFVDAVSARGTQILDTRKTTPTLRVLEKYAVRIGGGTNHRVGLYDRVLIKDNHRRLAAVAGRTGLAQSVARARAAFPELLVEVEVESLAELEDALDGRPDWVLLDNMPLPLMESCVQRVAGACRVEASGGITLANVAQVAATGVDAISLGCLTHSAPAADLSLELLSEEGEG